MDATKFSQPWLNVPMSGKDAQEGMQSWRPEQQATNTPKSDNRPAYVYQPWLGNVLVGR